MSKQGESLDIELPNVSTAADLKENMENYLERPKERNVKRLQALVDRNSTHQAVAFDEGLINYKVAHFSGCQGDLEYPNEALLEQDLSDSDCVQTREKLVAHARRVA